MPSAQLTVDPHFVVGAVNRRLFGSFVEHLGRCVYDGIYEPGHPSADDEGFRADPVNQTRLALGFPGLVSAVLLAQGRADGIARLWLIAEGHRR